MVKQVLLITLVVLSTMLAGAFGNINCYFCNSENDWEHTSCMDPMDAHVNTTVCPNNYACTRVSYVTNKVYYTMRGCEPADQICNNIYHGLLAYHPDLAAFNCYYCLTDHCNSASRLQIERQLAKEKIDSNLRKEKSANDYPFLSVN